jgi:hypothetical protein
MKLLNKPCQESNLCPYSCCLHDPLSKVDDCGLELMTLGFLFSLLDLSHNVASYNKEKISIYTLILHNSNSPVTFTSDI